MVWRQIADDVALLQYPFRVFGIDFARNVTLLRLRDGQVVIHSTAPFTPEDVAAVRKFGDPSWMIDVTLLHDTFAQQGRAALPNVRYLAPAGFSEISGVVTESLFPAPIDWVDQIDVLPIEGTRKHEHAVFHRHSRTLVVADLIFSFGASAGSWERFFVRHVMRLPRLRGVSVFFKMLISDRAAFERSMAHLLELDFTRLIVAHRDMIETDGKAVLNQALRDRGFEASLA